MVHTNTIKRWDKLNLDSRLEKLANQRISRLEYFYRALKTEKNNLHRTAKGILRKSFEIPYELQKEYVTLALMTAYANCYDSEKASGEYNHFEEEPKKEKFVLPKLNPIFTRYDANGALY